MTNNTLRTEIARALFERNYGASSASKEHFWRNARPERLKDADAMLAVLADPPADVIERAGKAIGWLPMRMTDANEDARAVLRAVFGGEQA